MNHLLKLGMLCGLSLFAPISRAGEAALFEERSLLGASVAIRSDVNDLGAYGVPVSINSLEVRSGTWEFCTDRDFRGSCQIFQPGIQITLNSGGGMRILSAREVRYRPTVADPNLSAPARIELYPEIDFRGAGMNFGRDTDLRYGIRSAIVHAGTWEICSDYGYRGRCQVLQPGQYRVLDGQMMGARSARLLTAQQAAQPAPNRALPAGSIAGAVVGALLGGAQAVPVQPAPQVVATNNGRIHFFPGAGLTGAPLSAIADIQNFKDYGFNDATQSIRVESGVWEVCTDSGFRGACRQLAPGDYPALWNSMLDRAISSARMVQAPSAGIAVGSQDGTFPAGAPETPHSVIMFSQEDFRGETFRANGDVENLRNTSMNDRAGSIFVRTGRWEFCTDSRYRATCLTLGPGSYGRLQYPMDRAISSFRRVG